MERVISRNLSPGEFDLVICEFLHEHELDTILGVSHKVRAAGKLRNRGFSVPGNFLFFYFFFFHQKLLLMRKDRKFPLKIKHPKLIHLDWVVKKSSNSLK